MRNIMDNEDKMVIWVIIGTVLVIAIPVLWKTFIHLPTRGSHVGYVTAIDDGIFCTTVYFKTELESSQEDTYKIPKDSLIKEDLMEARDGKNNVKITYKERNFSVCGRNTFEVEKLNLINK